MIGIGIGPGFGSKPVKAFVPTQLAGCMLWLRADKGTTIATGVSAWADQSGNADANRNAVQATGAKQPTLNASDGAYNGKPTLSFNSAATQFLRTGVWSSVIPNPATVFVVGNTDGSGAAQAFVDGLSVLSFLVDNTAASTLEMYQGAAFTKAGLTLGSPFAFAGVFNGAASSMYFNAKTAVATGGNVSGGTATGLSVGVAGNSTAEPLNGKIAEVIVYSGAMSAANIGLVLAYLGGRYGITIGS